jgi:hypothetical protein
VSEKGDQFGERDDGESQPTEDNADRRPDDDADLGRDESGAQLDPPASGQPGGG